MGKRKSSMTYHQKIMLAAIARTATKPAITSGRLYQGKMTLSIFGPNPQTRPCSSDSGLGLVNNETPMVVKKQTDQAIVARQKLPAAAELYCRMCAGSKKNLQTAAAKMPDTNPKKPPQGVVRFQNMPSKKVANNGA